MFSQSVLTYRLSRDGAPPQKLNSIDTRTWGLPEKATHRFCAFCVRSRKKKGDSRMFRFKMLISLFALVLLFTLLTFPYITTAHQSDICPVHKHTTNKIGFCFGVLDIETEYDPHTGCWMEESCTLGVRWTQTTCPDGVQDTCDAPDCGESTDECNEHRADHIWGCDGNNKPHTWYTCQYDSCPYGPSSS